MSAGRWCAGQEVEARAEAAAGSVREEQAAKKKVQAFAESLSDWDRGNQAFPPPAVLLRPTLLHRGASLPCPPSSLVPF